MKGKKFIRRNWNEVSKLGKRRKKKQIWRRAKGRHSKVREKRKGYPIKVMIGFRKDKKARGKIEDKKPVLIYNLKELESMNKNEIIIVGGVGRKKKLEIIKKAKEKGISIAGINANKILKKSERAIAKKNSQKKENTKSTKKETKVEEKK